jgi:hypothetical protein
MFMEDTQALQSSYYTASPTILLTLPAMDYTFIPFGTLPFDIHRRKPRILNYHWSSVPGAMKSHYTTDLGPSPNDEHRNRFSLRRLRIALPVGMEPSIPPWV